MIELGSQKDSVTDVSKTDSDLFARAAAIHSRILSIDTHVDIPPDFGTESYDPREAKERRGQIDLVGMEHGGLDAAFFIVYVGQGERNVVGYAQAIADALYAGSMAEAESMASAMEGGDFEDYESEGDDTEDPATGDDSPPPPAE